MMKSLSLLAVLVMGAIAVPSDAHAGTCSETLLVSYLNNWVPNQFSPALQFGTTCVECPPNGCPIGNGCPAPAQNWTCYAMTQQGVSGYWDWHKYNSCGTNPMSIRGSVVYRPNTLYSYNYRCQCSEGTYSCVWL